MSRRPIGWEPVNAEWWTVIASTLPVPWTREAVLFDLRWWKGQEAATSKRPETERIIRPGRPALAARWGWKDYAARRVMAAEVEWGDPRRRQPIASGSPADRQRRSSGDPAAEPENADYHAESTSRSPADRQPIASGDPADLPTRDPLFTGPPTTDHRTQATALNPPIPGGQRVSEASPQTSQDNHAPPKPPVNPGGRNGSPRHPAAGALPAEARWGGAPGILAADPRPAAVIGAGGVPDRAGAQPAPDSGWGDGRELNGAQPVSPVEFPVALTLNSCEVPGDLTALFYGFSANRFWGHGKVIAAFMGAGMDKTAHILDCSVAGLKLTSGFGGKQSKIPEEIAAFLERRWGIILPIAPAANGRPAAGVIETVRSHLDYYAQESA